MARLSTIGRPLDFRYKTNKAIAAIFVASAIVLFGVRLLQGRAVLPAAESAGLAALTVFLTWAIGREIDPDKDLSAFVGVALSLPTLFLYDAQGSMAMFWLLLTLRVINRTTGARATLLDSLVVVGGGAWLSFQFGAGVGVLTAIALLANVALDHAREHAASFGSFLVGLVATIAIGAQVRVVPLESQFVLAALAMGAAFVPLIVRSKSISTVGDLNGEPLDSRRVQSAQIFGLAVGVYFAARLGGTGLLICLPLWVAAVGSALWWAFEAVSATPAANGDSRE